MNMSFIERNFQEIENYFACCDNSKKRKLEDHNHESQKTKSLKINTVDDDVSRQRYITRMEKRNERERKRVQLVNKEFDCLRDIISNSEFFKSKLETNVFFDFSNLNRIDMENNLIYADLNSSNKENIYPLIDDCDAYNTSHKKLSKLKTLKLAIEYINYLSDLLNNDQSTVELKREYQSNESSSFDSSNFYFHNIMNENQMCASLIETKCQDDLEDLSDLNLDSDFDHLMIEKGNDEIYQTSPDLFLNNSLIDFSF